MPRDVYTGQSSDIGPLFSTPLARTSDPLPSHLAAKEIRESGSLDNQRGEVLAALREYVRNWGDAPTTRELCNGDEGMIRVFGKRLSDLEILGHVRRVGQRQCRLGHRLASTWEPTR